MSSKLRGLKRNKQKKDEMVLAIVDGSNTFGPEHCKFVPKSVAEKEGYVYVEGKTPEQLHRNMMKMAKGSQGQKTKEQLIKEHRELNEQFKAKLGKENVVAIAHKMCQIEDELLEVYGIDLFGEED